MITNVLTVLADDITGAAEIAGVCLRFGLSVAFDFDFNMQRQPSTDVWIIASDTRSLTEKEACKAVRKVARRLKTLQVKTVFKKIDSALRGHVLPEINALCENLPAEKVFILPANPETGRTIQDGIYRINGLPLHQTSFADDPDFPVQTAVVRDILHTGARSHSPPHKGGAGGEVITPDISTKEDYEEYARQLRPGILPVGGSVFFEACLPVFFPSAKPHAVAPEPVCKESSILMICGSTHEASKQFVRENQLFKRLEIASGFVEELLEEPENLRVWAAGAAFIFMQHKKLIISLKNENGSWVSSEKVKELLAKITAELLNRCRIDELLIEGGSTAHACLQAAGFASLIPVQEYARGVVRFQIPGRENLHLTMKPGSYEWSSKIFKS